MAQIKIAWIQNELRLDMKAYRFHVAFCGTFNHWACRFLSLTGDKTGPISAQLVINLATGQVKKVLQPGEDILEKHLPCESVHYPAEGGHFHQGTPLLRRG